MVRPPRVGVLVPLPSAPLSEKESRLAWWRKGSTEIFPLSSPAPAGRGRGHSSRWHSPVCPATSPPPAPSPARSPVWGKAGAARSSGAAAAVPAHGRCGAEVPRLPAAAALGWGRTAVPGARPSAGPPWVPAPAGWSGRWRGSLAGAAGAARARGRTWEKDGNYQFIFTFPFSKYQ